MFLPVQADYVQGATVVLVDYPPAVEGTAVADATGTATVAFDPVDNNFLWRVERITTFCDKATPQGAQCLVYEGPVIRPVRIRDGSSTPGLDIADENSPITIHPSAQLVIVWTGLTPGTNATVSAQYQLWRRIIVGS